MDKILIIDGHNQVWRAFIGFSPPKKEVKQDPNEASQADESFFTQVPEPKTIEPLPEKVDYTITFNFFRNLRPLVEMFQPDKIFFVLEGHAQFRYDLFAEYKANRKIVKEASKQEAHDKLYAQKEIIVQLMHYLPVTVIRAADYEADDTIATLCEHLKDEFVTILSSDTDFIQLLQKGYKNLQVYNPISKKFLEAPKYHYVAWKCLVGDTSDNIPGFSGIGDKTAQKMLADPEKFEKFMSLEENRANFSIYKQLIELRIVPEDQLIVSEGNRDWASLKEAFSKMEFNSLLNDKTWNRFVSTFDCVKY